MSGKLNCFDEFVKKYPGFVDGNEKITAEALGYWIVNVVNINRDIHTSEYLKEKYKKPKEYKYMLTFTLDPKKVNLSDRAVKSKIEDYIVNLLKTSENDRFYYSREHDDSNTHWHVIVHRKVPLRQDKLTYYKKKYGNVDVSRSKDLSDKNSFAYLGKESAIVTIK